ncbi:hypothetical protein [Picosynechococcus sp. PCC 7003]|uniref:hypothetical protein n=1 Tax=Picosynechococcus sp. PCC 7003 TaxID=374981 RepID=UPI000A7B6733|nr:hypothetical protein [Picosynechococcus sp. PCC 7003]
MTFQAITHPDIQISGDVRIHPRAVIAPGVILQATEGSYLAIAAGACIGAGAIIQAHGGNIEIHTGAIIGAGCLIIGQCSVGENACLGYGSTLFQTAIAAAAIFPPQSLIGDPSRQATTAPHQAQPPKPASKPTAQPRDPWQAEDTADQTATAFSPPGRSPTSSDPHRPNVQPPPEDVPPQTEAPNTEVMPTVPESNLPAESGEKTPVVGQVYINQLLMTLFPHQNSLNSPNQPDKS